MNGLNDGRKKYTLEEAHRVVSLLRGASAEGHRPPREDSPRAREPRGTNPWAPQLVALGRALGR
jgi:hypothetical protein